MITNTGDLNDDETKLEQENPNMETQDGQGKNKETRVQNPDITPPPNRCVPHRNNNIRGGGVGALEASRDTETGQEASRAVPVPGPTAERGARAAMADRGAWAAMAERDARAAMAERGAREAMAEQETWEAMVDPGTREAMAGQETLEAMVGPPQRPRPQPPPRSLWQEPYYPHPKFPWGK